MVDTGEPHIRDFVANGKLIEDQIANLPRGYFGLTEIVEFVFDVVDDFFDFELRSKELADLPLDGRR